MRSIYQWMAVFLFAVNGAIGAPHRFLCTDAAGGTISVVAADGTIEWRMERQHPQDCWQLSNGNFLFCHASGVIEVNMAKEIVWKYHAPSGAEVHACQPLADGRVMAVECGTCRIIEIDRTGAVVKEIKLPVPPSPIRVHDQFRGTRKTSDGHYLVSAKGQHKVLELDGEGVVVREIATPGDVHEVVSLPGGNLLISCGDGHRIIELDQNDHVVWELNENDVPGNPLRLMAGLQRLPNGNTIFCNYLGHGHAGEQPHFFGGTRDKKVVWEFADHEHFKTINQIQVLDVPGDVARGEVIR